MAIGDIVALSIARFHNLFGDGAASSEINGHIPGAADQ